MKQALLLAAALLAASSAQAQQLKVGSDAPSLTVEEWLKGDALTAFQPGQPYVVEFWATWCGPCIANIPHLTELQKKYGDKLTVIGVAASERAPDVETMRAKLVEFVEGRGKRMDYTVAFDSDGSMFVDWMEAAGQGGIPTAFLVGVDGKIEWLGHPMKGMDAAIEKAVAKRKKKKVAPAENRPFDLMVGDPAPAMHVAEWLQGEPVESFDRDRTYVVEFWATWCGPCIKNMPHLSELQEKHGDDVKVVGVSVWEDDVERVRPFFEENKGNMRYTVAREELDGEEGRMAQTWMTAAGRRGIPCAFVVDEGKVAWVGHPSQMDEPLAQIVAGEWNLGEEARTYAEKMERSIVQREIEGRLNTARMDGKTAEAFEVALELAKVNPAAAASVMNLVAWDVVDPERETPPQADEIALAVKVARKANKLSGGEDPYVLDTFATALFADGQLDKAIDVQMRALSFAPIDGQLIKDIKARLDEFRAVRSAQGDQ